MASSRDPHGIVPDSFWEEFDSIEEARNQAETTPEEKKKRCPECRSTHLTPRSNKPVSQTVHDWLCKKCRHSFDDPLPPLQEEVGEQTTIDGFGGGRE
ncbi:MAG: hypothetical protein RI560_13715 [Natronomonas sp.]|nr:hypothetical protein [Natronomonas sp.]